METLLREWRYSLRALTKSRGFSAIAILTLVLGIGASTAIFSVVDAVLLRALPFAKPQQIVRVWEQSPNGPPFVRIQQPQVPANHACRCATRSEYSGRAR